MKLRTLLFSLALALSSLSWATEPRTVGCKPTEFASYLKSELREPAPFIPRNGDSEFIHVPPPHELEPKVRQETPSAEVIGQLNGAHGGKLDVLRRTLDHWASSYAHRKNAIQGDPRWFTFQTGPKVGYFFGFRKIGEERMTIPDAKELSNAIRHLNMKILEKQGEPIGIQFYGDVHETTSRELVKRFAYERALPLATSGPLRLHDLSFHTSAMLLPNQLIQHAALQSERLLQLESFVRAKVAESPAAYSWVDSKDLFGRLMEMRAKQIDLSGNFAFVGALKRSRVGHVKGTPIELTDRDILEETARSAYTPFVQGGMSANEYLRDVAKRLNHELRYKYPEDPDLSPPESFQLRKWVEEFVRGHPDPKMSATLRFFNPSVERPMGIDVDSTGRIIATDPLIEKEMEAFEQAMLRKKAGIIQSVLSFVQ